MVWRGKKPVYRPKKVDVGLYRRLLSEGVEGGNGSGYPFNVIVLRPKPAPVPPVDGDGA